MQFPQTEEELIAAGYKFENRVHCRGCGAEMEFWLTPNGKHIPLKPGTFEPHWATCPQAKDFRK